MPLPWKRSKSGRISRFVSDLQQSPNPGGSLVVETGFPTSLIDLFVKNRDRIKKSSSKRINNTVQTPNHSRSSRRLPPLPLKRRTSLPTKLDHASFTDDPSVSKIDEGVFGGLTAKNRDEDDGKSSCGKDGGECVLMVGVFKVFVVVVLALSTKKLAVGITLSAFALLFLELAVARVFSLCPGTQIRLDSLIGKLIERKRQEMREEPSATQDIRNNFSFEIVQESREESRVPQSEQKKLNREDSSGTSEPEAEDKQVQTIRDVVFKIEKSKSSKLKSKIVKKIVPKKLRSYKKKKKMKIKGKLEDYEEGEEEEESVSEVSSLSSEESSERDDVSPNPPLLENCEEEEEEEIGSKRDLTKAIVMIAIALAGLLIGKVLAIGLILCCCLILRVFCSKSQKQTLNTIRGSGGWGQ